MPFTICYNNLKYLVVTLTKTVKDLFDENFKSFKKEIEEDIRRWKDLPSSWIDRINSKNGHLTESNLNIQCTPHKIPTQLFTDLKTILNFIWKNITLNIFKTIIINKGI